jgi:SNF2 family DNA or RNA helicase
MTVWIFTSSLNIIFDFLGSVELKEKQEIIRRLQNDVIGSIFVIRLQSEGLLF